MSDMVVFGLFVCSQILGTPKKAKKIKRSGTTDQVPVTVFQKVAFKQVLLSHFSAFITQNLMLPKVCTCLHAGNDGSGSITALMGRRCPHLMDNH